MNFDGSDFDGWVHQAYLKKITGALPSDTTAPEITFAFPAADGQTVTANTAVFSATITDAGTGVASAWWLLTKSGTSQHYKGSVSKTNYGWIAEEPDGSGYQVPLYEGSNIVEFAARDNAGNSATSTITVIYTPGSALGNTNSNLAETLQGLKSSLQDVKELLKLYQGQ